jgi:hypothetical protein
MWDSGPIIQFFCCAGMTLFLGAMPALAQESQQPTPQQDVQTQKPWDCIAPLCTMEPQKGDKPPQPYGGGTPLDVILNTRFWTDVPEAKPFVKATRPPEETLQYQPTAGKDVVRAKLKTSSELKAMEDDLERAGAAAERAAGVKKKNFHVEAKKTVSAKGRDHVEARDAQ